jgi:hypothetical protein
MSFGITIRVSKGRLGEQLNLIYELKLNGLEELIRNIKEISKTSLIYKINEVFTFK